MLNSNDFIIDAETIKKVGLRPANKPANSKIASNARVFEYPYLENVLVMESDLYGNIMPENFCFIAFYGTHGFKGSPLKVETLKNSSVEDIKKIVESSLDG
jgi:hypothetical protein